MEPVTLIFLILTGACLLWQIALVIIGAAMMGSAKYTNVKIGVLPLILAVVCAILAVVI